METNRYIIDFYNHYDEDSRLAPRHGMVEFLTTMRYIERFIRPGDRVLEIGAGTGRYSHALARQGYAVDAVELVEHNIEVFRQNTLPEENVRIVQGNALDLSAFPDRTYDIVLLLGPLYHLYNDEDKRQALREAIRVTKKGGVVFAAYVISDGCLLEMAFRHHKIDVAQYIKDGLLDGETFAAKSEPKDLFELVRKEDVDARNQADQMVYQSEKTLSEMGDKIPADDKSKVQAGIDKLKEVLKGTDTAAIKTATDELTQAFYAVSEKLYQQANPQGAQGGAQQQVLADLAFSFRLAADGLRCLTGCNANADAGANAGQCCDASAQSYQTCHNKLLLFIIM